jgi:hypothetical protein
VQQVDNKWISKLRVRILPEEDEENREEEKED